MLTFAEKSLKKNVEGAISHLGELHSRCGHGAATRDFMTYKAQTSIIDFMSLLGANAYYRLLFVEVENQRHAMNFLSILAPEVAHVIPKPVCSILVEFTGQTSMEWECFQFGISKPMTCVLGSEIISMCLLWEINFWYTWRAVFLNELKAHGEAPQCVVQKKNPKTWKTSHRARRPDC